MPERNVRMEEVDPAPEPPPLNPWTETVTGKERLKAMLEPEFWHDYRPFTKECFSLIKTSFVSCAVVGAFVAGYRTKKRFEKDHRMVIYRTPVHAKRKMHAHTMVGATIGAVRIGVDVAAAVSCALLGHGMLYVYQNRISFPGMLLGSVLFHVYYKLFKGYKKILAVSAVGILRGIPVGLALVGLFKLSGEEERRRRARDEARYQHYLRDVLLWRNEGLLMEESVERRSYYYKYVLAPRPWHTAEQNAETLKHRRLPPIDPEYEQYLWYERRAVRNRRIKIQEMKDTQGGGILPIWQRRVQSDDA
ncbi:uncharacterized protein LOC135808745 [Sycon ciliatum]|uniref:uncharacterized protein LOC135808745 n=1 Tax=Sycon ciliatum TaxID=27933 RepID=UPI0031F6BBF2